MQSLKAICGLSLNYYEESQQCGFDDDVMCASSKEVCLNELVPTLLNKSLRYPEYVYRFHEQIIRREDQPKWLPQIRYDMFVLPFGLLGIEYVKTHIYYTSLVANRIACIVEVAHGELTIILQKNMPKGELDFDTCVEEAWVVKVKTGQKAMVPTGYLFTFVNTSNACVVFSVVRTEEQVVDYRNLNREQGLAYFLIAKNARAEVVTNPRYRTKPSITNRNIADIAKLEIKLPQVPLYQMAVEAADQLSGILYNSVLA